jgi:hypothetical protein
MKTITYYNVPTAGSRAYADFECEAEARAFLLDNSTHIGTTTELFITACRVLIKEGVIPYTEVQFRFGVESLVESIQCNKDGRLERYPAGFCDTAEQLLYRLL